jgi:hypothetical protein
MDLSCSSRAILVLIFSCSCLAFWNIWQLFSNMLIWLVKDTIRCSSSAASMALVCIVPNTPTLCPAATIGCSMSTAGGAASSSSPPPPQNSLTRNSASSSARLGWFLRANGFPVCECLLSLCLSRACLGKTVSLVYEVVKSAVFSSPDVLYPARHLRAKHGPCGAATSQLLTPAVAKRHL